MESPIQPVEVFLCSTCYDLLDLRAEVADFLRQNRYVVRLSDDPGSAFEVDPQVDSIASCLKNVEISDVVVCIIDRRYGGVFKTGDYAGKSATHVEVEHALNKNRPVLYFIRKRAELDYQQLRKNPDYDPKWVEPRDPDRRKLWFDFVKWLFALPEHRERSNWYDSFGDSVELKPVLRKRLIDCFPRHIGIAAADPDRVVRMMFYFGGGSSHGLVMATLTNLGKGVALGVKWGVVVGGERNDLGSTDGLPESEMQHIEVTIPAGAGRVGVTFFAEYHNRFDDHYRFEVPLAEESKGMFKPTGERRLWVRVQAPPHDQWARIE